MAARGEGRILFTSSIASLMPGPTETEFFQRPDMLDTKVGAGDKDDAADVARDGLGALMAGKDRVVSASLSTKLQGRGSRFMPDSAKAKMHRRMAEPASRRSSQATTRSSSSEGSLTPSTNMPAPSPVFRNSTCSDRTR